jgi:hypothetical protein
VPDTCNEKTAPSTIDEPELTGPELAQPFRVDPATVRLWYDKEGMPGRKIGYRKILYRLSECNAWLEEREATKEKEWQQRAKERERAAWAETRATTARGKK